MSRTPRRVLVGVAVLAAVVRFAYWWLVTPGWVPNSDAAQYLSLARSVVDGDGFSLVFPQLEMHSTAFRPPLYPLVLLPGAALTDGLWAVRLTTLSRWGARWLCSQQCSPAGSGGERRGLP